MGRLSIIALEFGKAILVPSTVLIVSLVVGSLLLWSPLQRVGRWVTTITSIILLVVAIFPVSAWVAKPLETRFPQMQQLPNSVAGNILLGGAFQLGLTSDWAQPQVNSHADRLIAFMALARQYPNLKLVFSGGAFSDDLKTESDIARTLFESMGMDTSRIMFENRSRNTCENGIYSAQLVNPTQQQTWVLVTSAMDMPRAVGVFRKAGFRVLPYPVDYTTGKTATLDFIPTVVSNLEQLDHAAHEWLGLLAYRFLGCIDTLFPAP
jgi:uncharacterized SAM-binding protein YcdF (DUF218 family)